MGERCAHRHTTAQPGALRAFLLHRVLDSWQLLTGSGLASVGHLSSASRRAMPHPPRARRAPGQWGRPRRFLRGEPRSAGGGAFPGRSEAVPCLSPSFPPSFRLPPRRRRPDSFRDGGRDTQVRQSRGAVRRGRPAEGAGWFRAAPPGPRPSAGTCAGVAAHGAPLQPPPFPSPSVCGAARAERLPPLRTGVTPRAVTKAVFQTSAEVALTVSYKGLWLRLTNPFESQNFWVFPCLCDFFSLRLTSM
ncbi:uncharacterized protein LOC117244312 [Parus major]|uniref:uncharacterized protein LOC117244312 n=1 Tax=Parus major TaxID=9157 RepID=UPI001444606F|nr:uncharacterized protein LOC117244312 [Parus major]